MIIPIVNIIGILLIAGIYWFFFMKKEAQAVVVNKNIQINVKGGYQPEHIQIEQGTPVTLEFFRTDPSSCLEEVVIPDFGVREFLPLNEKKSITITPKNPGDYTMSCGMNMFHGKITVK